MIRMNFLLIFRSDYFLCHIKPNALNFMISSQFYPVDISLCLVKKLQRHIVKGSINIPISWKALLESGHEQK